VRAYQWLAAIAVAAACSASARAQYATPFGSPGNSTVTFNLINPSASTTSIAPPQTGLFSGSRLMDYFHWLSPQSTSPVIGVSNFPAPGATPGLSYLQGFGFKVGGQ
jgi:hypothetical protein